MKNKKRMIDRVEQSKPRQFFKPRELPCYKCSMPGLYHCEMAGCGLPLCLKHRIRKAGGNLCAKHRDAQLQQDDAEPQTRFKDSGDAIPHVDEESMNLKEWRKIKENQERFMASIRKKEEA